MYEQLIFYFVKKN